MKRFWKIYSNAAPIKQDSEIDENEVAECVSEIIDYRWDCNDISVPDGLDDKDFDAWFNARIAELADMLAERLKTNGRIDCGDYAVYIADEKPERADVYGWEEV